MRILEVLEEEWEEEVELVIVKGAKGRGAQQNLGAEHAAGSILAFLHADTWFEILNISFTQYWVTHQVSDYILLTLIWEFHPDMVPPCCLHGMPILPDLHPPKQNKADIETTKSNSIKCSHRPDGSPCTCVSLSIVSSYCYLLS